MKRKLKQSAQLLRLARAVEERERWTLESLEALRWKEVQALQDHRRERRAVLEQFAEERGRPAVSTERLTGQAEFLQWSRNRDGWFTPRIEAAQSKAAAQRELLLQVVNRRRTVEEVYNRLRRRASEEEGRRVQRAMDEQVTQRWRSGEDAEAGR
ncbi:MAG: hypothetical protein ACE5IM_07590 [Nitrospinota bacterium]